MRAGEVWMWFIFAASTAFAMTLNPELFDHILWSGFILRAALHISGRRRLRDRRA